MVSRKPEIILSREEGIMAALHKDCLACLYGEAVTHKLLLLALLPSPDSEVHDRAKHTRRRETDHCFEFGSLRRRAADD